MTKMTKKGENWIEWEKFNDWPFVLETSVTNFLCKQISHLFPHLPDVIYTLNISQVSGFCFFSRG